jgi:thioredoxin
MIENQTTHKPLDINVSDFEGLKNTTDLVLIDFWAVWCGPCKVMGPVLDTLAPEFPTVKFVKVNVDEVPEIAELFGVQSIPTFYMVKFSGDGTFDIKQHVTGKIVGAASPFDFKIAVEQLISKSNN